MSRCFPFPPPGYERKPRPEDLNLLKEAKHKEKKHKKDKKDKEKKRDKEKGKDGGDEKHRDRKERKEKHKDKKKDKEDRGKDKDKSSISEESTVSRKLEESGKKDKEDRGKDKDKSSISESSTVSRKLEESGGTRHPKGHSEGRRGLSNEGKCPAIVHGHNGGRPSPSSQPPSQAVDDLKFVQELDRRIRDDENGRGSQLPQKVPVVDKRNQEMAARNPSGLSSEGKADSKNKKIDRKTDPLRFGNEYSGDKLAPNTNPTLKNNGKGIPQNGRRMGEKERYNEAGDIKWRDKQNIRDSETPEKDKEKNKEDVVKVKTENKQTEQRKLKDDGKSSLGGFVGHTGTDLFKSSDNDSCNEGKIRKREDMDTNGFSHESDARPNKIQRSTNHPLTENGRKHGAFRAPIKPSHDTHAVSDSVRLEKRDRLLNGIIEAQKSFSSKPNPSASTTVSNQIAEAPKAPHNSNLNKVTLKVPEVEDLIAEALRRPPHPDSKYLTDVLTIPKVTDEFKEDENWFSKKNSPLRRPSKIGSSEKDDMHVWSEALRIENADVCALPYVIPY